MTDTEKPIVQGVNRGAYFEWSFHDEKLDGDVVVRIPSLPEVTTAMLYQADFIDEDVAGETDAALSRALTDEELSDIVNRYTLSTDELDFVAKKYALSDEMLADAVERLGLGADMANLASKR